MYHYVRQIKESKYKNINGLEWSDFVEQINFLNKNYNIISYSYLSFLLKNNKPIPKNSVVLTFDDGYKDHFKVHEFLNKKKNFRNIFSCCFSFKKPNYFRCK